MDFKILLMLAVDYFRRFLQIMIFIRIILSWLPISKNNILIELVYNLTEPILGPIRKIIFKSPLGGPGLMLDFSPIIATFFVEIAASVIINVIASF